MLNMESPVPLYHQLALILMDKIDSKEFLPGSKIPSENELAKVYRIGRPTVRQAVDSLVRKNVLERKKGSGTFVKAAGIEVDLFSLAGTSSAFFNKGLQVETEYLSEIQLITVQNRQRFASSVSAGQNPFNGEKAYFFSRLNKFEEKPVLIEYFYIDKNIFSGIDRLDLKKKPLSDMVLEYYDMRPSGGKQTFEIFFPEEEIRDIMAISKEIPLLLVKRFIHFKQSENAIYSEMICRTDRFVFSQTLSIG